MAIKPGLAPGRKFYRGQFRNPISRVQTSFSLGDDQVQAEGICRDLEALIELPALWTERRSPRLLAYHPRAVEILFGEDVGSRGSTAAVEWSADDAGFVAQFALRAVLDLCDVEFLRAGIERIKGEWSAELQEKYRLLETENKALRARLGDAEGELKVLRRVQNRHATVTIGQAVETWVSEYPAGRAAGTVREALRAVRAFRDFVGAKVLVGDVRSARVDEWIVGLKRLNRKDAKNGAKSAKNGEEDEVMDLSPVTKKKQRAYLSSFFSWARRRYDLVENPVQAAAAVAGASRRNAEIRAIDDWVVLDGFLKTLDKACKGTNAARGAFRILSPAWRGSTRYWRACVGTAVLAGPRYAELVALKVGDVRIKEGYLRIFGKKTGQVRKVALERTWLKPVLSAWIRGKKAEAWLFPSVVEGNVYRPRSLSPEGRWSDNGIFLDNWRKFAQQVLRADTTTPPWKYGPREWRHTAGTVLAHCGWNSREISEAMGNSETVARRHYVVPGSGGKRWGLKY